MANIPDEAVEVAAMAIFGVDRATWDLQVPEIRERYLGEARDALDAAAPALLAQAWDAGYLASVDDIFRDSELRKRGAELRAENAARNPYRVQEANRG